MPPSILRLEGVWEGVGGALQTLKGVCHEIFDLQFYHDSKPSGPLIHRIKDFRIRFRFRRDIQTLKKALRCASLRGIQLRSLHHTAESSSAMCIPPRSQVIKSFPKAPRSASHHGVRLRGVHHTAESSSAVCITLRSQ